MEKASLAERQPRMGESSQAEKESMSLGSLVGRNEIAKPWYTKSTMPASIKEALTRQPEVETKEVSKAERKAEKKADKADRKVEKKERKRDLKR